jgi:folate-binding protein YgfZ
MTPQYRTIAKGAAWLDASTRGRLRFEGPDAASFLHALVTNDVTGIPAGRGAYAAWLTPQGRMITDLRLLRDAGKVMAEVPEGLASALASRFDQLIFSEDVRVFDDSAVTRQIVVFGGHAARVVDEVVSQIGTCATDAASLPLLGHCHSGELRVVRMDHVALPNYSIWMPEDRWDRIVSALHNQGAVEDTATAAMFEALRIESGRPLFGVDMSTDTIPLEAGLLDRAISMTKGCYVGQEVIVRILHRGGGRVVKQLVKLAANPGVTAVPDAGTSVLDGDREVGKVTSAAMGPSTGQVMALAYVHRDSAEVHRRLALESGPEVEVVALTA